MSFFWWSAREARSSSLGDGLDWAPHMVVLRASWAALESGSAIFVWRSKMLGNASKSWLRTVFNGSQKRKWKQKGLKKERKVGVTGCFFLKTTKRSKGRKQGCKKFLQTAWMAFEKEKVSKDVLFCLVFSSLRMAWVLFAADDYRHAPWTTDVEVWRGGEFFALLLPVVYLPAIIRFANWAVMSV